MGFDSPHSRPHASPEIKIDVAGVYAVADRFATAARLLDDAVREHLCALVFDGSRAGRAHTEQGETLRAGLDRLAVGVSQWSRAADEIASALRSGADRYADTERYAAARIA